VRSVFRTFTAIELSDKSPEQQERLRAYNRALDALHLSVTTADGQPFPIISAHVEDWSVELGDDGYQGSFVVEPQPHFLPTGSFFDDPRYWDGPRRWPVEENDQPEVPDPTT
jgi:hypothetical protein